jgi:membrane-bound lytic murein transglycosylase B
MISGLARIVIWRKIVIVVGAWRKFGLAIPRLIPRMDLWRIGTVVVILALGLPGILCAAESPYANLEKRLIADGLDRRVVRSIYRHPQIKLELDVVAENLIRREAALNYDQFLSANAVAKARRYMRLHSRSLNESEQRFGVPGQIVVAIFMVETALGTYTGKYQTINVLSTMAVAEEQEVREQIIAALRSKEGKKQTPRSVNKRLQQRAVRSYRELKALIRYVHNHNMDPFEIHGSSEGAIGIPQFLPSNIARYGQDGNGDGRIDLFDHEDAIASAASYLWAHKWGKARGAKEQKEVLLQYNRSRYYANTVYGLAQKLSSVEVEP